MGVGESPTRRALGRCPPPNEARSWASKTSSTSPDAERNSIHARISGECSRGSTVHFGYSLRMVDTSSMSEASSNRPRWDVSRLLWHGRQAPWLDGSFSLQDGPSIPLRQIAGIAGAIGFLAMIVSAVIAHPIRFQGVGVGDIGLPIVAMRMLMDGQSPYSLILREGAVTLYPFTTSVVLSPFLLLPVKFWAPIFTGLGTGFLSAGILFKGRPWQLLALVTPCYLSTIHSVQWSPFLAASLLLPFLLPLATAKPQIGIVLILCGRWTSVSVGLASSIVIISLSVFPNWPLEWISQGNLDLYLGKSPLTVLPGFLLLSAGILWRNPRARLVFAMSIVQQRYYYDQLLIFLVPRSMSQMLFLVSASWGGFFAAWRLHPEVLRAGTQHGDVWSLLMWTLYIPALGLVWFNHWTDRRAARDPEGGVGDTAENLGIADSMRCAQGLR